MTLKEKFNEQIKLYNQCMMSIFFICAFFVLEAILLVTFFITSTILFLFLGIPVLLIIVYGILFYRKKHKLQEGLISELERYLRPNACCICGETRRENYPKLYNLIKTVAYNENSKTYICKNQDKEYRILDAMVESIDEVNNMVKIIDFIEPVIGEVVTVEYILKDLICIVSNQEGKLYLADIDGINLKQS